MLLDILNEDNCLNINLKSIQLLGLKTAAYLSLLVAIEKKATRKNKLIDGYFKLDRKYVTKVLGLVVEEQLVCDANLMKVSIMKRKQDDPNSIKLEILLYLSLLNEDDLKLIENVKKQMIVERPKGIKLSQRQMQINNLKDCISCSNYELLTALRNWVDGVYANPRGFLSKTSIQAFQDTLNNYTKGDLDLALRIVKIATIQGYKDCIWAINLYEKDRKEEEKNNKIRITNQETASKEELSDKIF